MKLVEEGQLGLDDKMAKILNDTVFSFRSGNIHGYASACEKITEMGKKKSPPFAFLFQDYRSCTERITVRHHLTHTSQGVPGDAYRYNGFLYGSPDIGTYTFTVTSGNMNRLIKVSL
jgi:CubicO group peptidase (beta-lactamase class C family)